MSSTWEDAGAGDVAGPQLPGTPSPRGARPRPRDVSWAVISRRRSQMAQLSFNPMAPEFVADPYPTYHRLRAEDPVHRSPLGFWVLTRYEDVVLSLRDPRFGKQALAEVVAARYGGMPVGF